jgi:hypothetical protein
MLDNSPILAAFTIYAKLKIHTVVCQGPYGVILANLGVPWTTKSGAPSNPFMSQGSHLVTAENLEN